MIRRTPQSNRLALVLDRFESLAVAVSGGVDSMTLTTFAHRRAPGAVTAIHAVSPAVPAAATQRVRDLAAAEGWTLLVTGAGELEDVRYRDNPVNRCYFCKTNLYERIKGLRRTASRRAPISTISVIIALACLRQRSVTWFTPLLKPK